MAQAKIPPQAAGKKQIVSTHIVHILAFQDKRFDLYAKAEDW